MVKCIEVEWNKGVSLTKSEILVISLLASDLTQKEIARKLNLSYHTIFSHVRNSRDKVGCINSIGLVRFALVNNLIQF